MEGRIMVAICPIVEKKINEKTARVNAFFTFLLTGIALIFSLEWLFLIIAIDFGMRAFFNERYSLLSQLSRMILSFIQSSPVYINAGPKIFAARVGLAMTVMTGLMVFFGWYTGGIIVGGLLILFSILESVFGYCVACKLYPFLYQFQMKLNQK